MASPSKQPLPHLRRPGLATRSMSDDTSQTQQQSERDISPTSTHNMSQNQQQPEGNVSPTSTHNTFRNQGQPVGNMYSSSTNIIVPEEKYDALEGEFSRQMHEITHLKGDITRLKGEIDHEKVLRSSMPVEGDGNQAKLESLYKDYDKAMTEKGALEIRIKNLSTAHSNLLRANTKLNADLELCNRNYSDVKRAHAAEQQKNATQKGQVKGVEKRLTIMERDIEKMRGENEDLLAEKAHLEGVLRQRKSRPTEEHIADNEAKTSQIYELEEANKALAEQTHGLENDIVKLRDTHVDEISVLKKNHTDEINKMRNKLNASESPKKTVTTHELLGEEQPKKKRRRRQRKSKALHHELGSRLQSGAESASEDETGEQASGNLPQSGVEPELENEIVEQESGSIPQFGAEPGLKNEIVEQGPSSIPQLGAESGLEDEIAEKGSGSIPQSAAESASEDEAVEQGSGSIPRSAAETASEDEAVEQGSGSIPQSAAESASEDEAVEQGSGSIPQSAAESASEDEAVEQGSGSIPQPGAAESASVGELVEQESGSTPQLGAESASEDEIVVPELGSDPQVGSESAEENEIVVPELGGEPQPGDELESKATTINIFRFPPAGAKTSTLVKYYNILVILFFLTWFLMWLWETHQAAIARTEMRSRLAYGGHVIWQPTPTVVKYWKYHRSGRTPTAPWPARSMSQF